MAKYFFNLTFVFVLISLVGVEIIIAQDSVSIVSSRWVQFTPEPEPELPTTTTKPFTGI